MSNCFLVSDFGQISIDTEDRSDVMRRLLACYREEGLMKQSSDHDHEDVKGDDIDNNSSKSSTSSTTSTTSSTSSSTSTTTSSSTFETTASGRRLVRLQGKPISVGIRNKIFIALQQWSNSGLKSGTTRERPSIQASSYMILKSPAEVLKLGPKKFEKALFKFKQYESIWKLAIEALNEIDSDFAAKIDAVAVTHNFTGSPHIDKQNTGPFYGLSLGNFVDGK